MEQVGTAFIEIEADLSNLRRGLERDLKRVTDAVDSPALSIEADLSNLRRSLDRDFRRITNSVSVPDIEVGADVGSAESALRDVRSSVPNLDIEVDADIGRAESALRDVRSSVPNLDVQVEADISSARSDIERLRNEAKEGISVPIEARSANGQGSFLDSLVPAAPLAAAGLAAGAAFVVAFDTASDLNALPGKFQAQLDVTSAEAEQLGQVTGALFANAYGDSLEDLSVITTDVVRGLGDEFDSLGDDEVGDLIADVANIGVAFDKSSEEVSDAIRGILTNDLAETAEDAADILAKGLQFDASGDIIDTFREYGTELSQVGVSAEEFLSIAEAGLNAGARNTDFIADAIKEGNIRIQEGGQESVDALTKLGLDAAAVQASISAGGESADVAFSGVLDALAGVDDEVLKNELGVAVLGTKYEDLSADIIDAMAGASGAVEGLDLASENLDESINDNLGTTLTTIGRQFQTGAGRLLQPVAAGLNDALQGIIPLVSDGIRSLTSSIDFSGIGGDLGDIGGSISDVFSGIDLSGLDFSFVSKGVAAVSAVFGSFSKVVSEFVAENKDTFTAIGQAFVDAFSLVGEVLGFVFDLIIDNQDIFVDIFSVFADVLGVVFDVVGFLLPIVVDLAEVLFEVAQVILPPLVSVLGFLVGVIADVVGFIRDRLIFQFEAISFVIGVVVDAVTGFVSVWRDGFEIVSGVVTDSIGAVISGISGLVSRILGFHVSVFNAAKGLGSSIIDGIKNGIGAIAGIAGDLASTIGNAIKGFVNSNLIDPINSALEFTIALPGVPDVSVDAPDIPRLANGGIFDSLTPAIVGEAGAEAVIPLTRPGRALELLRESGLDSLLLNNLAGSSSNASVLPSGGSSSGSGTVTNNFTVVAREGQDERLIGRSLLEQIAGSELSGS